MFLKYHKLLNYTYNDPFLRDLTESIYFFLNHPLEHGCLKFVRDYDIINVTTSYRSPVSLSVYMLFFQYLRSFLVK